MTNPVSTAQLSVPTLKGNPPKVLNEQVTQFNYPQLSAQKLGLLMLVRPQIVSHLAELEHHLLARYSAQSNRAFTIDKAISAFLPSLLKRLDGIVNRTLVLELNIAKLTGQLQGDDKKSRFNHFVEKLSCLNYAQKLRDEYVELFDCVERAMTQWADFCLETLGRLQQDYQMLAAEFASGINDIGYLSHISGDLGDSHNDGRSVVVMHFESGVKVVYKPRSLALDKAYNEVIRWFNQQLEPLPLRTVKIIDREDYGWCEFIQAESLAEADDAQDYYYRFGRLLCIMYLLGATDIHFENLIAAGSHPVVIDLETLLTPKVTARQSYTLLSTSMLPQKLWFGKNEQGVDFGALTAQPGSEVAMSAYGIVDNSTDEMRWGQCRTFLSHSFNLPRLGADVVTFEHYVAAIINGFSEAFELAIAERQALLSEHHVIHRLTRLAARYVLRDTQFYSQLLNASYHPDLLRSQNARRSFIYQSLQQSDTDKLASQALMKIEADDLLEGNIPLFYTCLSDCALYFGGAVLQHDFFKGSGRSCLIERLTQLNTSQLAHHQWLLSAVLTQSLPTQSNHYMDDILPKWSSCLADHDDEQKRQQWLLSGATAIGEYLLATAIDSEQDVCWMGYHPAPTHWVLDEINCDLYSGRLGPVLFLAHLGALTGQPRFVETAQRGWQGVSYLVEREKPYQSLGFSGWGGFIYTLSTLMRLWPDVDFAKPLNNALAQLESLISQDDQFDIISGCAGGLLALVQLSKQPSQKVRAIQLAECCAKHLMNNAITEQGGCYWPILDGGKPLLGFSHGNAGIALALDSFGKSANSQEHCLVAQKAMAFEDRYYCPQQQNWPDLRPGDRPRFMSTWCHGDVGIVLSRCLQDSLSIDSQNPDVSLLLTKQWSVKNHGLCHGLMGNLDILHSVALQNGNAQLKSCFDQRLEQIAAAVTDNGWISAIPAGQIQPGLMDGLSGIGYVLLKFAHPEKIPNVLALSPAVAESRR